MPGPPENRPYHHGNLRTALLLAAEGALRVRGADGVSLRDLAREVGVSHAAPRRHFPDRQALLDALAEEGFLRLHRMLKQALTDAGDGLQARLQATMTAYTRFATENAALMELMYASKHRSDATRVLAAAVAPFELMHEVVARGQADGDIVAGDTERIGIVLFATLQGIAAIINGRIVRPELLDGLVETAVEQFLRGSRPPDGQTLAGGRGGA